MKKKRLNIAYNSSFIISFLLCTQNVLQQKSFLIILYGTKGHTKLSLNIYFFDLPVCSSRK